MVTTPPFAATAVALWGVVLLGMIAAICLGTTAGSTGRNRFKLWRRWRLVPGSGRNSSGAFCPDCGAEALRVLHGHPTATNILRASLGHMVIMTDTACPPPFACVACGLRFAEPAAVTPLPATRLTSHLHRCGDRAGGGLAPVVPLFGDPAHAGATERRTQPG